MEQVIYEDEKIIEYWLTNEEKDDAALQQHIRDECQNWKKKTFVAVVFYSGKADLLASTKPLISYNLKLMLDKEKAADADLKKGA